MANDYSTNGHYNRFRVRATAPVGTVVYGRMDPNHPACDRPGHDHLQDECMGYADARPATGCARCGGKVGTMRNGRPFRFCYRCNRGGK